MFAHKIKSMIGNFHLWDWIMSVLRTFWILKYSRFWTFRLGKTFSILIIILITSILGSFVCFLTVSPAGLELMILLSLLSELQDYKQEPPRPILSMRLCFCLWVFENVCMHISAYGGRRLMSAISRVFVCLFVMKQDLLLNRELTCWG